MTEPISPIEQSTEQTTHAETNSSIGTGASHQSVHLPRITITYCTQCKWMLRAAYFGQELLSTFGTTLGEVSLVPATGGIFSVTILYSTSSSISKNDLSETLLWDRKTHGGFPEVKQLKALVRNIVDPTRNLGHVDRALDKANKEKDGTSQAGRPADNDTTTTTHSEGAVSQQKESHVHANPKSQEACEDCQ